MSWASKAWNDVSDAASHPADTLQSGYQSVARVASNPDYQDAAGWGLGYLGGPMGLAGMAALHPLLGKGGFGRNLQYYAGHPRDYGTDLFNGSRDRLKRQDAQDAAKYQAGQAASNYAQAYSNSNGITGGLAAARGIEASHHKIADLEMQYRQQEAQRRAEAMQTLQSIFTLLGYGVTAGG